MQRTAPLLLGGYGDELLRLAARHADVVSLTGLATAPDGSVRLLPAATPAERVAFTRAAAGERADDLVFDLLVHEVAVTADEDAIAAVRSLFAPQMTAGDFGALATVLCGTAPELADRLRAVREDLGIGYVTVAASDMEDFAAVMALLR